MYCCCIAGEDHHEVLAKRYGIPTASTRDALYDLMQASGTTMLRFVGLARSQMLVNSALQPTKAGHRVFAEIVAYAMQQTLAEELRRIAAEGAHVAAIPEERSARTQQVQQLLQKLPPPVGPLAAEEVDGDPLCSMDQAFKNVVTSSAQWTWGTDGSFPACPHEHCRVWGYR
jgi:hypothetical protein